MICVSILSHYQSVEGDRSGTEYVSISLKMSLEGYGALIRIPWIFGYILIL